MAAVAVNRVYRNSLSIAALQYRLGHFDAALASIQEAIKIAQNKNDHETVLDCSLWLHQIKRALGKNKEVTEAPKKRKDSSKGKAEEGKNG